MYYCFLTKSWWNRLFNPEVTCILYLFDLFTLMNKWRVLTERRNYVGENCNEKKRYLFYFRIETPSGSFFFFLPSSLCRREIERRGERRRPQVTFLDYQLNAWGEWERKKEREWRRREVGIGWGKGKGVKKGVMFSFPFVSAWWLQAVDFHLTLLHIVLSLQSVWKLRPQRAEGRGKESKEV